MQEVGAKRDPFTNLIVLCRKRGLPPHGRQQESTSVWLSTKSRSSSKDLLCLEEEEEDNDDGHVSIVPRSCHHATKTVSSKSRWRSRQCFFLHAHAHRMMTRWCLRETRRNFGSPGGRQTDVRSSYCLDHVCRHWPRLSNVPTEATDRPTDRAPVVCLSSIAT